MLKCLYLIFLPKVDLAAQAVSEAAFQINEPLRTFNEHNAPPIEVSFHTTVNRSHNTHGPQNLGEHSHIQSKA